MYDTDAFANSLTGGLTEALQALPAAGPLQERAVHLAISAGAPPAGAVPLGARPGTSLAAPASGVADASAATATPEEDGLQARTRRLIALGLVHYAMGGLMPTPAARTIARMQ